MIFDSHIHTQRYGGTPEENRRELLASMKKAGVSGGVILSMDPSEYTSISPADRLQHVLDLCGEEKNLFPFYFIDPMCDTALDEVEAAAKANIMGFKIICSGFYPSHENVLAVCRRVAELDKPVIFHSGILWDGKDSAKYNRPGEFECLLDVPHLRFSLAHISWPWCDECLAVYGKFNNAYSLRPDLSCEMYIDVTPGTPRNYRRQVFSNIFLGDYTMKYNMLFGTDCDTKNYGVSWTKEWIKRDTALYRELVPDDSDDLIEHIYNKNLFRFLGLSNEKVNKIIPQVAV